MHLRAPLTWLFAAALLAWGGAPVDSRGAAPVGAVSLAEVVTAASDSALYRVTFDSAWSRIRNTHFNPDAVGPTWDAVRDELRPLAIDAASPFEFRGVLNEMLGRLGESHFVLIPNEAGDAFGVASDPTTASAGSGHPGVHFRVVDGEVAATEVRRGSSAEAAGLATGWILEAIGELSVDTLAVWVHRTSPGQERTKALRVWLPTAIEHRLTGPVGEPVELLLRSPAGERREVAVIRDEPAGETVRFGSLPPVQVAVETELLDVGDGLRMGIIRFSGWFPLIMPRIAEAVDAFRELDGIVIDLRGNPGGVGGLVMGVGGHFVDEELDLGTFRTRDASLRFTINPQRVGPDGRRVTPFAGPLAILVDALSASTSEIFAGGMQAIGRAHIVGEPTPGYALPAVIVPLPNGDRLMHAVADYTTPDGTRLEGRGVQPDLFAPHTLPSLRAGVDEGLTHALDWIAGAVEEPRSPPPLSSPSTEHQP